MITAASTGNKCKITEEEEEEEEEEETRSGECLRSSVKISTNR